MSMTSICVDLRAVWQTARRRPAYFVVAALTLGVGYGAHFAAFGLIDRLLLSPPAHVTAADRVFRLHVDRADVGGSRFLWFQTPHTAYLEFRERARSFSAMAAYRTSRASVGAGADARQIAMVYADHYYFPLLGVTAARGRVFTAEENQAPVGQPVVVLSDAYWRAAFGADETVLGRTLRIGGDVFTIIGIAPPGFTGDMQERVDAWAPLYAGVRELPAIWSTSRLYRSVLVLTRLAPGATRESAALDAAATYRQANAGTPAADDTAVVVLASLLPGRTQRGDLTNQARIALWLEGVALIVLLVAIANVVNLQLSRAAAERRQMAIRVALGAGRRRLVTTLSGEMLLVASGGAAVGLLLTFWSATALHQLLLPDASAMIDVSRLMSVVGATVAGATSILVLLAAVQVRMDGLSDRLKTGRGGEGFSRARLRHGLLVSQVVMSALLLVGAGLFLRSIVRVGQLEFGIDPDRMLAISVPLASVGYSDPAAEAFYERALDELAGVPGVDAVSASHSTPFAPSQRVTLFVPGLEPLPFEAGDYPTFYTVTPGYFATSGMRILRGRGFSDADGAGAPPVIILEAALANTLWPGQDAIGKCITLSAADRPCREVVGIANNTRRFVGTASGALRFYVPMGQRVLQLPPQALMVRATGDPAALIPAVRAALLRVDPNLPYAQIRLLRDLAEPEMRPWRMGGTLFALFGAAALFVASAGVYALLSVVVTQRTREIGVRLALGASPARARWMIVGQCFGWVAAGLGLGLAAAWAMGRYVEPLLFETSASDPAAFVGAAAVLAVVALAASLAPAVRASRVDPTTALRAE
jgi:predicted permease